MARVHYSSPGGTVIVTDVYVSVDATADPELAARLVSDRGLNTVRCPGESAPHRVEIPVVYHGPDLMVLVMPLSQRHRELHERAALCAAIAEDTSVPVPAYVRDFRVVYGGAGLSALLESEAERVLGQARHADEGAAIARQRAEIEARTRGLAEAQAEIDRLSAQLDASTRDLNQLGRSLEDREAALDRRTSELDRRTAELERRTRELSAALADARVAPTAPATTPPTAPDTAPFELADSDVIAEQEAPATRRRPTGEHVRARTGRPPIVHEENTDSLDEEIDGAELPFAEGEVIAADQIVGDAAPPRRPNEPVGEHHETRIGGRTDVAIEKWIVSHDKSVKLVDETGMARLAVCAEPDELELLVAERLGMKLQLHQLPTYPLITMSFGSPEMMRGEDTRRRPLVFFFDVAEPDDRAVLDKLAREFLFRFELYDAEYLAVSQRTVTAELSENAGYLLATAEERLAAMSPRERSFDRAIIGYDAPTYDRFGINHPEHREFRDDKLGTLGGAAEVRRAVAIARRFSAPELETYLVCVRGYPLSRWRVRRREVLEHAIECGLWIGQTLSQVAMSEGLVRSRKELVTQLRANFAGTATELARDVDEEAVADNWNALDAEAEKLGLGPRSAEAHNSADASMVSGTIGGTGVEAAASVRASAPVAHRTVEQLIAQLEDPDRRLDAAVELARRGEERAIGPVFNSLRRMTRNEAVRVLGSAVGFGPRVAPHLIDGLRSRKSYLRQGCALALGSAPTEEAIEALCDQLVSEPTEIWREVARAVGQAGPAAVMSLVARLSGQDAEVRERVAWALANVITGGGDRPVRTLATGRDPAAKAVAHRALELSGQAHTENQEVLGPEVPAEQTVNRAFSRSFFEALGEIRPGAVPVMVEPIADLSAPAMLLDEADLMEAPDLATTSEDAEMLDDSDLIPS